MTFTKEALERYRRHLILKNVGERGQKKIAKAKVMVIGAGGLGSPVLLYLAAAGVGTLGIVDADEVDLSNLQRQVIHATPDLASAKVVSAAEKIGRLNPHIEVKTHKGQADSDNILALIEDYDFVIDGTDNFASKFLINDACVLAGKPFSHAGVLQFTGQTMTVLPGRSACYRCVFGAPPPDDLPGADQVGILGAVPGVLGTLQATESLKFITGAGDLLTDRLMIFDALAMTFRNVPVQADPACPVCGREPRITAMADYEQTVRGLEPWPDIGC